MKKKTLVMAALCLVSGVMMSVAPAQAAQASATNIPQMSTPEADGRANNPFELVYAGAITENVKGKVNIRPVTYKLNGITIAANVYLPADYDEKSPKLYPAITVAHPNGGDKEQTAGLYAQRLAEAGYITIAADASYQGASGGTPRLRDYPSNRIDDVSGMVDYLEGMAKVDKNRIGSLGICGGGGYTIAAAETDKRIKAVATISMFNSGRVRRNGFQDKQMNTTQERLEKAVTARNEELKGNVQIEAFLPPNLTEAQLREKMAELPDGLYKDGIEYYGITHRSPRATGSYTTESLAKLIAFDVEDRIGLLNQPLLMIAGSKADTLYMTKDVYRKATNAKPKELYLIDGASHIQTYWVPQYVDQAVTQLVKFFGANL